MKIKSILLALLFCCISVLALDQNSKSPDKPIEINITKALKTQNSFKMSQLADDVEFIFMESTPKCYMAGITELSFGKNYIMAAFGSIQPNSTQLVHIFDRKGKYIRSLGTTGKGPGEFIPPFKAIMDPSELFVLIIDVNQRKLITYSLEGKLLQEQKYDRNNSRTSPFPAIDKDGHIYLHYERPYQAVDYFPSLIKLDNDLKPSQDILIREKNQDQTLSLSRNKFIATPDHLLFWESCWDTVYYVSPKGEAQAMYHFKIDKNQWPKKYLTNSAATKPHLNEFTSVSGIQDLPGYLIFTVRNGRFNYLVYDKAKGESFNTTDPRKCYTPSKDEIEIDGIIEDDLLGFERLGLGTYIPDQKLIVYQVNPSYLLSGYDVECLKKKKVLFPDKRDKLIDYAENTTGEEGPLLIVMHLK